jgi:hypothetical protein
LVPVRTSRPVRLALPTAADARPTSVTPSTTGGVLHRQGALFACAPSPMRFPCSTRS